MPRKWVRWSKEMSTKSCTRRSARDEPMGFPARTDSRYFWRKNTARAYTVIAYFLRSTFWSPGVSMSLFSLSFSLENFATRMLSSLRPCRPSSSDVADCSLLKIQMKFFSSCTVTGFVRVMPPTSLARISDRR